MALKLFKKRVINDVILVIGDSHTRVFSDSTMFFPVFVGAGKEFNLLNDNSTLSILEKSIKIIKNSKHKNVLLNFGEPDTRYFLGKGWYPWKDNQVSYNIDLKNSITTSVDNYLFLVKRLENIFRNKDFYITEVNPSPRSDQNQLIIKYNKALNLKLSNYQIIKSFDYFYDDVNDIPYEMYISPEDPVHLNSRIIDFYSKFFSSKLNLKLSDLNNTGSDANDVRHKFEYNKKFGCFILK